MATPIVVPGLGESVTEATVAKWLKKVGDAVKADEPLVELETDKVTLESTRRPPAPWARSPRRKAAVVAVGAVLGQIADGAVAAAAPAKPGARRRAAARCAGAGRSRAAPAAAAERRPPRRCRRPCARWWRRTTSIRPQSPAPARMAA